MKQSTLEIEKGSISVLGASSSMLVDPQNQSECTVGLAALMVRPREGAVRPVKSPFWGFAFMIRVSSTSRGRR